MKDVIDAARAWLAEHGWREFPIASFDQHAANFAKKFPTSLKCLTNGDDGDIVIVLRIWDHRKHDKKTPVGYDINLSGHCEPDEWVNFEHMVYQNIEDISDEYLNSACARLVRAWEASGPVEESDLDRLIEYTEGRIECYGELLHVDDHIQVIVDYNEGILNALKKLASIEASGPVEQEVEE